MKPTGKLSRYFLPCALLMVASPAHSWWNPAPYPPPPPMPVPAPYYQPAYRPAYQPAPVAQECKGDSQQLASLNASLLSEQKKNAALKKEIAYHHDLQKKMTADISQLRASSHSASQQQSTQLSSVKAQIDQLNADSAKNQEAQRQNYNSQIQGLQAQLNEAGKDKQALAGAQEKISLLESELMPLRENYNAMQAEYESLKGEQASLNANFLQSQDAMKSTDGEMQQLLSDKDAAAQQIGSLSAERDELVAARDIALAELESLRNEVSAFKGTESDYAAKMQENVAAITSKDEELNELRAQITALKTEMENKAVALNNMQGDMETRATAFDALQAEFNALSEKYASSKETESQAAGLSQELQQLRSSLDQREQSLTSLTSERDALATTLQALKGQESEWLTQEQALVALKDELARAQESAEKTRQELVTAQESLQSQEQALESAKTEAMQGKELEAQFEDYKTQCAEKDQSILALKQEKDNLLALTTDTDNDGVADANDQCPDTEAGNLVDTTGCLPDSDKDGIKDAADLCSDSPAGEKVNALGCASGETIVLSGVNFKYNSAIFTSNALPVLDDVTATLQKHPTVKVEIAGYTDSSGPDEANLALSQQRADAVWKYLTDSGVEANRLVSSGYGETSPVADNGKAEGRARNRRVELHILSE